MYGEVDFNIKQRSLIAYNDVTNSVFLQIPIIIAGLITG